eukprot:TRINITY_DN8844_c0_g2_i1.p1 TRINITY_DN8844_c0_g2~~TRINITY_DN8844_c0_g2_i1.p1  ORF type:complete len:569 (+),score=92.94 TRINITY_DN8844_c0_g2_i1:160-1866(+)
MVPCGKADRWRAVVQRLRPSCLILPPLLLSCLVLFGPLQNPNSWLKGVPDGNQKRDTEASSVPRGETGEAHGSGNRELGRRKLGEVEEGKDGAGGEKISGVVAADALPIVEVLSEGDEGENPIRSEGEGDEQDANGANGQLENEDGGEVWTGGGKGGFQEVGTGSNAVDQKSREGIDESDPALLRQRARLDWIVEHLKEPEEGWPERRDKTEPTGSVYHDAGRFRATYRFMEKYLRIYVYSERNHPLTHTAGCKDIYAIDGIIFNNLVEGSKFFTRDQKKANLFFIPLSFVNLVQYLWDHERNYDSMKAYVRAYIDSISARYNYWNRTGGADHFMLTCHDWGPYLSEAHKELEHNAIRVMCNAKENVTLVPGKDLGLPEINVQGTIVDPKKLGGLPPAERTILAFFAGADHGPTRPVLFKYWLEKDKEVVVYQKIPENVLKKMSYDDHMQRSKFCLCPGGYEVNSPRIVEAIYADCVPVIIADGFSLPFSDTLNWSTFSVRVPEAQIPDLKDILSAVPEAQYIAMQKNLRVVRQHFVINDPPKSYDVFHMILHSLWLQRLHLHESGRI